MLGRTYGELGVDELEVLHLLGHGFTTAARCRRFLTVYLLQNVGNVFRHVDGGSHGVDGYGVAVALHADRLCVLLAEGIGKSVEEAFLGLHYFHGGALGFAHLWGHVVHDDGVAPGVKVAYLLVQIVLSGTPLQSLSKLTEGGMFFLQQCRHGAVCSVTLSDVLACGPVHLQQRGGVDIHECHCHRHDEGNNGVAYRYFQCDTVLLHPDTSFIVRSKFVQSYKKKVCLHFWRHTFIIFAHFDGLLFFILLLRRCQQELELLLLELGLLLELLRWCQQELLPR